MFPDTERLEFLMQFLSVEDCGDEDVCAGIVVDEDALSMAFDTGALADEQVTIMDGWIHPDMRRAIDKAIAFRRAQYHTDAVCGATDDDYDLEDYSPERGSRLDRDRFLGR